MTSVSHPPQDGFCAKSRNQSWQLTQRQQASEAQNRFRDAVSNPVPKGNGHRGDTQECIAALFGNNISQMENRIQRVVTQLSWLKQSYTHRHRQISNYWMEKLGTEGYHGMMSFTYSFQTFKTRIRNIKTPSSFSRFLCVFAVECYVWVPGVDGLFPTVLSPCREEMRSLGRWQNQSHTTLKTTHWC